MRMGFDGNVLCAATGSATANSEAAKSRTSKRRGERLWREAVSVRGLPQEDDVLERAAVAEKTALSSKWKEESDVQGLIRRTRKLDGGFNEKAR